MQTKQVAISKEYFKHNAGNQTPEGKYAPKF